MEVEELRRLPRGTELDYFRKDWVGDGRWVKAKFVCMSDVKLSREDPKTPCAIVEIEPLVDGDGQMYGSEYWMAEYARPDCLRPRHESITFYGKSWLDTHGELIFYGWLAEKFNEEEVAEALKPHGFVKWFGDIKTSVVERPVKKVEP